MSIEKSDPVEPVAAQGKDTPFEVCVISDEPDVVARLTSICLEFGFKMLLCSSIDEFLDGGKGQFKLVVASLKDFNKAESAAELAQCIRHLTRESGFIISCVPKTVPKEAAIFAKKSGANLILMRDEILTTSKLEFVALQTIKSSFLTVKGTDIAPNLQLPFALYHLLASKGKFIKFSAEGDSLTDKKFAKILDVGEIYIHRDAADSFKTFVESRGDKSAAGLARRCRAQYLALHASFLNLILLLTDQSESGSFDEGQRLLKICQTMCDELLGLLSERGEAWEVINNSAIGEFGSVERGPVLAAYAGLFGLQMGLPHLNDIMLAALLTDLGLILLVPSIAKKIREDRVKDMTGSELAEYKTYPNQSLELCLTRKLPLEHKFREILISTNERADGRGFPRNINQDKLSLGAQLIQFCRDLDRRTVLKLGSYRPQRDQVLRQMLQEDGDMAARYTSEFWTLMRKVLQ